MKKSKELAAIAKTLSDEGVLSKEPTSYLLNFMFLRKLVKKHTGKFLKTRELENLSDIIQKDYGIGQAQKGNRAKAGDLAKMAHQLFNKNAISQSAKLDLLSLHRLVKRHFGTKLNTGNLQKLISVLHHDYQVPIAESVGKLHRLKSRTNL